MADEGNEVFIDDYESSSAEEAAASAAPAVIEGDDIPEQFRGKTAKEIAEAADRAMKALRVSEDARLAALEKRVNTPAESAPAGPAAEPEPEPLTEEAFAQMYEENPTKALMLMAERVASTTERNVLARIAPMQAGARSAAENAAKQKYADEFEILGPEIEAVVKKIPNPSYLSNPGAWDDVMAYVRGQNIDKIIEHKMKKVSAGAENTARTEQINSTGFTSTRPIAAAPAGGSDPSHFGLDETERKVADTLNQSYKDYARYKKMGR